MAVQAQYPSNVLLLNRSVQEVKNPLGNDYPSQPPQSGGGGFLDQSHHMIFTCAEVGTNNNPRKRGRETTTATEFTSPVLSNTHISNPNFSIQPHQLIDLTQPNNAAVSTGLRLAFGEQQQLRQQQLQQQLRQRLRQRQEQEQQQQQQQQTLSPQSSSPILSSSVLSDDLAAQIRQQRDEIEQFLHAQGEQLRRTLAEKSHRHYRALLGAAEESAARRLREKEDEAEKAARRNAELEARAAQLVAEAQAWQSRARAQEAAAASLQAQLQHAVMGGGDRGGKLGCGGGDEAEDAGSAYVDPDRVVVASVGPSCKACRKRVATVVVLPCRHLCLCTECGGLAQACPLCLSFRESSVEVFLS